MFLIPGVSHPVQNPLGDPPENANAIKSNELFNNDAPLSSSGDPTAYDGSPPRTVRTYITKDYRPYFSFFVCFFSLAFCFLLVHGAVTYRPAELLPYFFLQVFDFIINLLTIAGQMSASADVRLRQNQFHSVHNKAAYVSSLGVGIMKLSFLFLALIFRAYCLGMVWDCYKYLVQVNQHASLWRHRGTGSNLRGIWGLFRNHRQVNGNRSTGVDESGVSDLTTSVPVYDQANALPDYEDVFKIPVNAFAPPPYFDPSSKKTESGAKSASSPSSDNPSANSENNGNAPH